MVAGFNEWRTGDKLFAYEMVVKAQTLEGVKEAAAAPEEEEVFA